MSDIGTDAGGSVKGIEFAGMADDQVDVAVNPPVLMLAHLIRENACGIVVFRIGGGAAGTGDIFPTFAAISAAGDTAFFDADEDFIRDAGVEGDAANVGGMRRRRKRPFMVFR